MSVINKMLNDLEAREARATINSDYQPPIKRSRKGLWALLTLLVFLAVGGTYFTLQKQSLSALDKVVNRIGNKPQSPENTLTSQTDDAALHKTLLETTNNEHDAVGHVDNVLSAESLTSSNVNNNQSGFPVAMGQEHSVSDDNDKLAKMRESEAVLDKFVATTSDETDSVKSGMQTEPQHQDQTKDIETPRAEQTIAIAKHPAPTLKITEANPDNSLASLKAEVNAALSHGQTLEAVDLLKKLVAIEPKNTVARKQLASLYFEVNQAQSAINLLNAGLSIEPMQVDFNLMLSRIYKTINQPERALSILVSAQTDDSTSLSFLSARAALAQQASEFQLALTDYQALIRQQPTEARWWLGHGICADKLNQRDNALVSYQQVIQLSQLSREVEQFVSQRIQALGDVQ